MIRIVIATSIFLFVGILPAMADCASAANAEARKRGGEVLNVVATQKDGKTICHVTIRTPGKNGKPPRVETRKIKE